MARNKKVPLEEFTASRADEGARRRAALRLLLAMQGVKTAETDPTGMLLDETFSFAGSNDPFRASIQDPELSNAASSAYQFSQFLEKGKKRRSFSPEDQAKREALMRLAFQPMSGVPEGIDVVRQSPSQGRAAEQARMLEELRARMEKKRAKKKSERNRRRAQQEERGFRSKYGGIFNNPLNY